MLGSLTPETLTPIRYERGEVIILDQRQLPDVISWVSLRTVHDVVDAIASMQVRGAPAIGVVGAFGMAIGVRSISNQKKISNELSSILESLIAARPTAINLKWGCQCVYDTIKDVSDPIERVEKAFARAEFIRRDDIQRCQTLSQLGSHLIEDGDKVLTICNAGAFATAGYGTAVGVIRAANESGKRIHVWVSETRPRLQGAKLTTLELKTLDIPHSLITDNAAGYLMSQGEVSKVIVGADRIAANGDTANKIGTYTLAILAKAHKIPLIVAAPWSTIDLNCTSGCEIPLEYRSQEEVLRVQGKKITTEGVKALNVAFDVTPSELISAFVTEKGIVTPPFKIERVTSEVQR